MGPPSVVRSWPLYSYIGRQIGWYGLCRRSIKALSQSTMLAAVNYMGYRYFDARPLSPVLTVHGKGGSATFVSRSGQDQSQLMAGVSCPGDFIPK